MGGPRSVREEKRKEALPLKGRDEEYTMFLFGGGAGQVGSIRKE